MTHRIFRRMMVLIKKAKLCLAAGMLILLGALAVAPCAYPAQDKPPQAQDQILGDLAQKITTTHATSDALLKEGNRLDKHIDKASEGIGRVTGDWITTTIMTGVSWLKLITCTVLILLVLILERVVRYILDKRLRARFDRQPRLQIIASLLEALNRPLSMFILVYGVFWSFSPIIFGFKNVEELKIIPVVMQRAADLAAAFALAWFAYRLTFLLEKHLTAIAAKTESELDNLLIPLLGKILRVLVIIFGSAIIIHSITGLNFGPMLASLGIGGAAIALAAKESIANFLGSMTIVFDKPFTVGDRIVIDNYDGVVEQVGFRSTRVRTLDGHLVTIPNEKVINTTINNISKQPYIRWLSTITISYQTQPEKLERAMEIIRDILENHEGMHQDLPPSVTLNAFTGGALSISMIAWYHPPDYARYSAWVQSTSLKILKALASEGIEFAFPVQTLYTADGKIKQ
jgi:MscS family membrane protein